MLNCKRTIRERRQQLCWCDQEFYILLISGLPNKMTWSFWRRTTKEQKYASRPTDKNDQFLPPLTETNCQINVWERPLPTIPVCKNVDIIIDLLANSCTLDITCPNSSHRALTFLIGWSHQMSPLAIVNFCPIGSVCNGCTKSKHGV